MKRYCYFCKDYEENNINIVVFDCKKCALNNNLSGVETWFFNKDVIEETSIIIYNKYINYNFEFNNTKIVLRYGNILMKIAGMPFTLQNSKEKLKTILAFI